MGSLWRALSSLRLAAALMACLGLALLVGSLVPQAPVEARGGVEAYSLWLQTQRASLGRWTALMDALSLFHVAGAWWFRSLLALLAVSLGVHVLGRAGAVLSRSRRRGITHDPSGVLSGRETAMIVSGAGLEETERRVRSALRSAGYQVQSEREQTAVALLGERHRWHRLGTVANHLGLGIVLAAAVVGSLTGFRETLFAVPEGSTLPIGRGTGLSVRNHGFTASWHPGTTVARDFVTDITLLKDGAPVREHFPLRVNHPLRYGGISLHQASYGPSVDLTVTGPGGETLHDGGVPLTYTGEAERPTGILQLPGRRLWVVAPRLTGTDTVVQPGEVRIAVYRDVGGAEQRIGEINAPQGKQVTYAGLSVVFRRERQYSGLGVTRNPAAPYVWGGVLIMLAGTLGALYFPHRAVRVRLRAGENVTNVLVVAGPGRRMGREAEFGRVVAAIRAGVGAQALRAPREVSGARAGSE